MRYVRPLLLGAGAALLPFAVVGAFVWVRTGRGIGMDALLGPGELFPPAALMAGQALATSYGVPTPLRTTLWRIEVIVGWVVVVLASSFLTVPYSGAAGFEPRVARTSAVLFAIGFVCRLSTVRGDYRGEPP